MLPLIVFSAEEFVRGYMHRIQDIQRLQGLLDEDSGKSWRADHSANRDEILYFYGCKKGMMNHYRGSGIANVDGMNVCMGKAFYKKHFAPHLFEKKPLPCHISKKEKAKEWKETLSQNGYEVEVEIKNEKTAVCCVYARKII